MHKPVRVELGNSFAEFRPYDGSRVEVEIDFANPLIGRQSIAVDVTADSFRKELARARTFGFLVRRRAALGRGLCLGASLDNAVVLGEDRVINPEGLRFPNEFVRHKALDAVGDIGLASAPILGCYKSYRGGHRLNVLALEALLADTDAWSYVERRLPAARAVMPSFPRGWRRRRSGRTVLGGSIARSGSIAGLTLEQDRTEPGAT